MSIEFKLIAELKPLLIDNLIADIRKESEKMENMSEFSSLPSSVIFYPKNNLDGSLHYMYFPACASQEFHYHPTERYLIIIGNVDVYISHTPINISENPYENFETYKIKKNTITAVRFSPFYWHKFETKSDLSKNGVVVFSFHGADDISGIPQHILPHMMEELTTFWSKNGK